jgi:hypothetical protein
MCVTLPLCLSMFLLNVPQLEVLGLVVRNADEIVDEAYQSGLPNLVEVLHAANQIVLVSLILSSCFRVLMVVFSS